MGKVNHFLKHFKLDTIYKEVSISEYDYRLDEKRIAKHPLIERDASKLLIYKDGDVSSSTFSSIVNEVSPDDLMIFNNSKVVQARLYFTKSTGATIEVFLLNPIKPDDYISAFEQTQQNQWNCIVGNIKRWKEEPLKLQITELNLVLQAKKIGRTDDGALVGFSWNNPAVSFAQIIEHAGEVPIPPYLNRQPEPIDKSRYQTVYAKPEGSVAAPTAGLHFTNRVMDMLTNKGVQFIETTLHVGAGTFRPVKSATIGNHDMHTERIYVSKELINRLLLSQRDIIAVGTTSLRTLESIYWLGVKITEGRTKDDNYSVSQWDGYNLRQDLSLIKVLTNLKKHIESCENGYLSASTQMIIVPGYTFRVVDRLITNFHQPRSTLLLLVAAFIGKSWKKVYQYALNNDFRFLSYGDSSILTRS